MPEKNLVAEVFTDARSYSPKDRLYLDTVQGFIDEADISTSAGKSRLRNNLRAEFYRHNNLSPDVFIEALLRAGLVQIFTPEQFSAHLQERHAGNQRIKPNSKQ